MRHSKQMGLEGMKARKARKGSSKATGSDKSAGRMHEASPRKGMHLNIECFSRLPSCSAKSPRAAIAIGYCDLLLESLWIIFKGHLSLRSATLDSVKDNGDSEVCKFDLSGRKTCWLYPGLEKTSWSPSSRAHALGF